MRMKLIALTVMIGALLLPTAAAADTHWAAQETDKLVAKLGWTTTVGLDTPIPVSEWNRLVARLAGVQPGDADPAVNPKQAWVWMYTGGISPGSMVVRREDAIGGMMKLASLLYQEKANSGDPSLLTPFADGDQVSKRQQVLVAGAVKYGLIKGYPGGLLNPQRPLTVAEAEALISRLIDRYEAAFPLPQALAAPEQRWPQPDGFGRNSDLHLPPAQVINAGWSVGTVGPLWWTLHGAGYAADLPGVGAAPGGQVWLVVDTELRNGNTQAYTVTPDSIRFVLNDAKQSLYEYPVDRAATAALAGHFPQETVTLQPGAAMRGFLVFAVPAGTSSIWIECDTTLGHAPGKPGWNGVSRTPLGDLPGL